MTLERNGITAKALKHQTINLNHTVSHTFFFNPLHPDISIHILYTLLYTFPLVLTRRICFTIKLSQVGHYFLLIQQYYCVEKLHS